jgi:hypothetical protein
VNAKGVERVTGPSLAGQSLQWRLRAVQFLENGDLLFNNIGEPVRVKLKKGGRHSFTHVRSGSMMLKKPRGEERMVIPCCGSQHG